MRVVALDQSTEKAFWNHVNQDPLNYHFFIFDWKLGKDQTKILLTMEEGKIEGLMLVYRDYVVQLRGKREAVKLLLDQLNLEKVELQAPLDCEDIVLKKYMPKIREEMMLMSLQKGEENIQITTEPTRLGVEDAEAIAELMRKADPSWWGEVTAERIRLRIGDAFWQGIRQDQKIVSVGMVRLTDFGSNISVVATHERHRNRGYATSIVSALVKEILKSSQTALIHVISDNAPAIRVYSKVGFKSYKTYLSIRT
jgi:predicted GNAT family acetyltransferase